MIGTATAGSRLRNPDKFYIGGEWVEPSSAATIEVIDSNDEQPFLRVAEATAADMERAVGAARGAFDRGEWRRLSHLERAGYLRAMGAELRARSDTLADILPRESGMLFAHSQKSGGEASWLLDYYADLAADYPWEEPAPTVGALGGPSLSLAQFGLIVREPVGVVAAIVAWNGPVRGALMKIAPAMLAGCTVVLKASPEAPGAVYLIAEAAEAAGLPPGVLNVVTADREVSELLVRDPRVDKIALTGSTAAGRRIASIMAERIGRFTLELGGKSAALILDDADLEAAAAKLAAAECLLTGQVCASLTRIIVPRRRHDEFAELLGHNFSQKRVGSTFDPESEMGPLAMASQRDRVEGYVAKGIDEGATLVTGGGRPKHLDRGYFIEPTVFANVDNAQTIAREEIFGPVLSVIPADSEEDAIRIANDSPYGLNASVFTKDPDKARYVAGELQSGTVGHNGFCIDLAISFGGFKQSGIGREGGREGLLPYLEVKTVLLDAPPARYRS
jgi:aldehyde dehydrogenase (NAD+)